MSANLNAHLASARTDAIVRDAAAHRPSRRTDRRLRVRSLRLRPPRPAFVRARRAPVA